MYVQVCHRACMAIGTAFGNQCLSHYHVCPGDQTWVKGLVASLFIHLAGPEMYVSASVYVCVCVHAPVCVCVCVCMHAHMCARAHVCVCVYMCVRVCVCVCVCLNVALCRCCTVLIRCVRLGLCGEHSLLISTLALFYIFRQGLM